jgi:hypothetical protein
MKKINPGIQAFFCTGYTSDEAITSLLAEERLQAIQKPIQPDKFIRTVRELLPTL